MRKYRDILKGSYQGVTHRKKIFNIAYNNKIYTFDPSDHIYLVFKNSNKLEIGSYIRSKGNFYLHYEEPCPYV